MVMPEPGETQQSVREAVKQSPEAVMCISDQKNPGILLQVRFWAYKHRIVIDCHEEAETFCRLTYLFFFSQTPAKLPR